MTSLTIDALTAADTSARITAALDAASVQASALDYVGAVEGLDFRSRPWIPGQPNRFAVGDRLVFDMVTASVGRVSRSATLAMLTRDRPRNDNAADPA